MGQVSREGNNPPKRAEDRANEGEEDPLSRDKSVQQIHSEQSELISCDLPAYSDSINRGIPQYIYIYTHMVA